MLRAGVLKPNEAPAGSRWASRRDRCIFSRLAHVYDEKSCVVTCGGLEHVQHADVHEYPISPCVAETDLDALRGSRLLHDQGDKKQEEGQVVFVDQIQGVFPEDLLLKIAEKPSPRGVRAGRPGPETHVAQARRSQDEYRASPIPPFPHAHSPARLVCPDGSLFRLAICENRPYIFPFAANRDVPSSGARLPAADYITTNSTPALHKSPR